MSALKQILTELREKRLWPVALVLVIALVAVPTLLAKSSSRTPIAPPAPSAPSPASAATAVPAVSVETTPTNSKLKGQGRDPFLQQKLAVAATPPSVSSHAASSVTGGASASGSSTAGAPGSNATSTSGASTSTPLPRIRFYRFATSLRFGRVGHGLRSINDVDKFTPLPSASNPIVLFLGLRNDGRTAVFLLSSSASATGQGRCEPSRWSCNFLRLKVGQRELLLAQGALGHIAQYELEVTRIHPVPTTAPAKAATSHVSASGRRLVHRAERFVPTLGSLTYSASTGLLRFRHRAAVSLVHVGRLAADTVPASRAPAGRASS